VFVGSGQDGYSELYVVNADGTGLRRLTRDRRVKQYPTWSPDGQKVAFTVGRGEAVFDVYVINADGTGRRRLTYDTGAAIARWSHDGSRLVLTTERPDGSYDLDVIPASGARPKPLFAKPADRRNGTWSPDGATVAYMSGVVLTLASPSGRVQTRLRGVGKLGGWFPDGRSLAAVRAGVERVSRTGARAGTLIPPRPAGVASVAIAPDGRHIAFQALEQPDSEDDKLFVATVGGDDLTIVSGDLRVETPDWQPVCTIYGTARPDVLRGTPGADKICGLEGNDVIFGGGGDDIIIGGPDDDCVDGGAGNDWLFGAAGDDTIVARYGGRDIVDGGPGDDRGSYDTVNDMTRDITIRLRGLVALHACGHN